MKPFNNLKVEEVSINAHKIHVDFVKNVKYSLTVKVASIDWSLENFNIQCLSLDKDFERSENEFRDLKFQNLNERST